jgi:hypothetical protein
MSNGLIGMRNAQGESKKVRGRHPHIADIMWQIVAPLSVFVQMLLNPDNMTLERLTPVAFKARLRMFRAHNSLM